MPLAPQQDRQAGERFCNFGGPLFANRRATVDAHGYSCVLIGNLPDNRRMNRVFDIGIAEPGDLAESVQDHPNLDPTGTLVEKALNPRGAPQGSYVGLSDQQHQLGKIAYRARYRIETGRRIYDYPCIMGDQYIDQARIVGRLAGFQHGLVCAGQKMHTVHATQHVRVEQGLIQLGDVLQCVLNGERGFLIEMQCGMTDGG